MSLIRLPFLDELLINNAPIYSRDWIHISLLTATDESQDKLTYVN